MKLPAAPVIYVTSSSVLLLCEPLDSHIKATKLRLAKLLMAPDLHFKKLEIDWFLMGLLSSSSAVFVFPSPTYPSIHSSI